MPPDIGDSFACNLAALSPAERTRHHALLRAVRSAVRSSAETPDGYRLRLDERLSLADAGEWIALERRCCPFLRFELTVLGSATDLTLSGARGAKEIIALEVLSAS